MDHLDTLEQQSTHSFREAFRHFERLCMLWSIGTDSTLLLWLARTAFFGHVPFPLVHIDTSYKLPEMIQYRDRLAMEYQLTMAVGQDAHSINAGHTFPATQHLPDGHPDKLTRTQCGKPLKAGALKATLTGTGERKRLTLTTGVYEKDSDCEPDHGVIVGVRGDEEGRRSQKRHFSPRDDRAAWDIAQPPRELVNRFTPDVAPDSHVRIHPLLDWTALNIWEYLKRESVPTLPLSVDQGEGTRFRSLGCAPCVKPISSHTATVDDVIIELWETARRR